MGHTSRQQATTCRHSACDLEDMRRLAGIEGQVRSLRGMIEEDRSTSEVLLGLRTVMDALKEVALSRVGQEICTRMDALLSRAASEDDVTQLRSLHQSVMEIFRLPDHSDRRLG